MTEYQHCHGRIKITHEDNSIEYVTWERADEPTVEGTPINKALFDNLQNYLLENIYRQSTNTTTTITLDSNVGTTTTEIQTDGSRFVILTLVGDYGTDNKRRTNCAILYDCLENKMIIYINWGNLSAYQDIKINAEPTNINYMLSSTNYAFNSYLTLSYNVTTKKITVTTTATTSSSRATGEVTIKCYNNISGRA